MDIENNFSWSKSRDELFNECKRKYFYNHYGSWGGWDSNSPERVRELYILKKLSTRHIWIGQVVHETIKYFLIQLKGGINLKLNQLAFRLKKKLKEDYDCSEAGTYRTFPKKCGLVEHEYKYLISKDEWDKLFETAEKGVMNFYNSDVLKEIKKLPTANWLFLEDFLSFDFEGTKVYLSIDFAIKNNNNQIVIYDWKTGKERDVEMDIQLACYALFAMQKWNLDPSRIIINRYNVVLDKLDEFEVTSKMVEDIKDYMRKSIGEMKNVLNDKDNNIAKEEDFPKTNNIKNCIRCNFKKVCDIV